MSPPNSAPIADPEVLHLFPPPLVEEPDAVYDCHIDTEDGQPSLEPMPDDNTMPKDLRQLSADILHQN